jgi:hypothetical protein
MLKVLESLIEPLDFDTFCNEYYQKKAIKFNSGLIKSAINFNWESLNKLLNTRKIPYAKINLFTNGNQLPDPTEQFSILRHCTSGGELQVKDIELYDLNIREFAYSLADQLKCLIQTSLNVSSGINYPQKYISQFYNSFVIQLAGQKKWQVFHPNSTNRQNNLNQELLPYLECNLQAGKILFIPAKHFYKSENIEPSLNLTLKIIQPNGINFLSWFINNELVEEELFIKSFPLEFNESSDDNWVSPAWQERLSELFATVKNKLSDQDIITRYYEFLVKNQQGAVNYSFPSPFIAIPVNDLKTVKLFRPDYQDCVIKVNIEQNTVDTFFWKKKLSFPLKFETLVRYVFNKTEMSGKELLGLSGELSEEEINGWVNNLIKQGILQFQQIA